MGTTSVSTSRVALASAPPHTAARWCSPRRRGPRRRGRRGARPRRPPPEGHPPAGAVVPARRARPRFDFPPLEAQRLGNLPIPRTPIVGRREESEHILEALRSTPVLTLTGPGGIGKTRLAVEVARTVAPSYGDGAFFVGLAAVDDPLAVPAVVVRTLGLSEEPGELPPTRSHVVSAIASSCSCWTTSSASPPRRRSSPT